MSKQQTKALVYQFIQALIATPSVPIRIRLEALDTIRRQTPDLGHVIELALRIFNNSLSEDARMDAFKSLASIMESGIDK